MIAGGDVFHHGQFAHKTHELGHYSSTLLTTHHWHFITQWSEEQHINFLPATLPQKSSTFEVQSLVQVKCEECTEEPLCLV